MLATPSFAFVTDRAVLPPVTSESRRSRRAVQALYGITIGLLFRALTRMEHLVDSSEMSRAPGSRRIRHGAGLMLGIYAAVLEGIALSHGTVPTLPLLLLMGSVAFVGRGGRFIHYFVPVFLGLFAYLLAGRLVDDLKLSVHYTPQIRLEHWLFPGPTPTVWLQQHLYGGSTGALEAFAVAMYLSHFWVPLVFGFALVLLGRGRAFATLMFGILTVSILAETTFVLAPTAPPWLAAQDGYLPPVDHILKDSLYDLHFTQLANLVGDSQRYDVTAAVPSMHVAFPLLCLFTARRYGLPRPVSVALGLNTLAVVFAIVYTGDHYVVDALAGALYAAGAWVIVGRLMGSDERAQARPVTRGAAGAAVGSPRSVTSDGHPVPYLPGAHGRAGRACATSGAVP